MHTFRYSPTAFLPAGLEFSLFGKWDVRISFYAICILTGMIIAVILSLREAKKIGVNKDDLFNGAVWGIVFGIIGARLYYVICDFGYYSHHFGEIFAIWNGGLAIHGGIIAAFVFAYFYCKKKNMSFIKVMDIVVIGLFIGQICGRWGNFFNQEAHGGETTLEFLQKLPIPNFIVKQMCIDGVYYHPTFFYESFFNLIGLIIILILRRTKTIKLGDVTGFYLIWYGALRVWIEHMRTDWLPFFGSEHLRQNIIISILMVIIGIVYLIVKRKKCDLDYYINYIEVDNSDVDFIDNPKEVLEDDFKESKEYENKGEV